MTVTESSENALTVGDIFYLLEDRTLMSKPRQAIVDAGFVPSFTLRIAGQRASITIKVTKPGDQEAFVAHFDVQRKPHSENELQDYAEVLAWNAALGLSMGVLL